MTLNEYQDFTHETAVYPSKYGLVYPSLGLAGEAGEAVEKVKKALRKGGLDHLDRDGFASELGDVLYYVARCAWDAGFTLDEIAKLNQDKLLDRKARDVIRGEGDNR